MTRLTKSDILTGCQCPKALWLRKHGDCCGIRPDELPPSAQFIIDQGRRVGELARERLPGGVNLLDSVGLGVDRRIEETSRLVEEGTPVMYEAAFEYAGAVCAVDILVGDGDGWQLLEVKSGTSVKDYHALDVAFQVWVLRHCGLRIDDAFLTHVSNDYVRRGDLDLNQLFADESMLITVRDMQQTVGERVAHLRTVLEQGECPDVPIGPHCTKPVDCPFRGHCWRHVPERSVFDLVRGGRKCWELYRSGVMAIRDIPDDYKLTAAQRTQVEAAKTGNSFIEHGKIQAFLDKLEWPIAHMDFETYAPAVPDFDGMRPYQQVSFQWSVHRQEQCGGEISHHEFLAEADGDPREPFVTYLLGAVEGAGSVLVYNRAFEDGRLIELQAHLPQYAARIQALRDRLVDLMEPFQRRWFYTQEMHGSYSIKAVLPALVPELSYSELDIGDGATASAAFVGLRGERDPARIAQIRSQLLAYCAMDTWAMVRLLDKLFELVTG